MPLYREQGVVLRTHKLGEADRIVTLLTPRRGVLRAVAKGVRRTSSKFGARLEPFTVVDLQCYEGRTLDTITQAVTLESHGHLISGDYDRYRAGTVMLETAERLGDGDDSSGLFALLVGSLRNLSGERAPIGLARDSFLLRAMSLSGWTPGLRECVRCGASGPHTLAVVQLGGVVCEACRVPGAPRFEPGTITLLSALLEPDWQAALASSERERAQAAGFVVAYTQWHLERGLRSLAENGRR